MNNYAGNIGASDYGRDSGDGQKWRCPGTVEQ
jgi:hypothetical protein